MVEKEIKNYYIYITWIILILLIHYSSNIYSKNCFIFERLEFIVEIGNK